MFLAVLFSLCVCSRRLGHTGGAGTPRGDRAHLPTASIAAFAASSFGADMPPSLQTHLLALTSNYKLVRLLSALPLCAVTVPLALRNLNGGGRAGVRAARACILAGLRGARAADQSRANSL